MADQFRISGKRVKLPDPARGWKFQTRPGGWIVAERTLEDGAVERKRFALVESKGRLSISIGGHLWSGEVNSMGHGTTSGGGGASDLVAQFPGKVRKLLVQEGARVKEGESLMMVEAMKMEFPVKAPSDGVVKRVCVKEGQQLSPGDRFVDFEEEAGGA